MVDAQLVVQRHVGAGRCALGGLEVDDPDPAVRVALDPVGCPVSCIRLLAQIDLAGEAHLGAEQLRSGRRSCQARNRFRAAARPRPARPPTASWRRSRAVPDRVQVVRSDRSRSRGIGRAAPPCSASTCTTEPKLAAVLRVDSPRASRARNHCRGQASTPRQLAARQPDRRSGGAHRRRSASVSSAIPHQLAGPRRAPAAAVGIAQRGQPSQPSRRGLAETGGASGSIADRAQLGDQAGEVSGRAGPPGARRTATPSSARNRDGWSPSPSGPATAVTTSRRPPGCRRRRTAAAPRRSGRGRHRRQPVGPSRSAPAANRGGVRRARRPPAPRPPRPAATPGPWPGGRSAPGPRAPRVSGSRTVSAGIC